MMEKLSVGFVHRVRCAICAIFVDQDTNKISGIDDVSGSIFSQTKIP